MRAWKCDRCGKLYVAPSTDKKLDSVNINQISYGTDTLKRTKVLCDDCIDAFILWFKEPALTAITNEGE
jgi:hypothetical protein